MDKQTIKRRKVLHIITGLNNGGAERTLVKLLCQPSSNINVEHVVLSLTDEGYYGAEIQRHNLKLICLNLTSSLTSILKLFKLYKIILNESPDVVQTWLYHADLLGGLCAKFAGVKTIYWNIRSNDLKKGKSSPLTILIRKICARLSFIPQKIVCCSRGAIGTHTAIGYRKDKFIYIPNGYDVSSFSHVPELSQRAQLAIPCDNFVLGAVGRYNPQKDYRNLLLALRIVKQTLSKFTVLLVGIGLDKNNHELLTLIKENDLEQQVILMGMSSQVQAIYNTLDTLILSSRSEGFPNVLAEAMLCGTPCISTDVGDAKYIIGSSGIVVEKENPSKLAAAIIQMISLSSDEFNSMKVNARLHIMNNYSIESMINSYINLYLNLES